MVVGNYNSCSSPQVPIRSLWVLWLDFTPITYAGSCCRCPGPGFVSPFSFLSLLGGMFSVHASNVRKAFLASSPGRNGMVQCISHPDDSPQRYRDRCQRTLLCRLMVYSRDTTSAMAERCFLPVVWTLDISARCQSHSRGAERTLSRKLTGWG